MRRAVAVLVCAATVLLLLAPAASATKPFQVRITDPASFVLPGNVFCGFDVQVDVEQKFKIIQFTGDRGTWVTAATVGKIKVVLTNLETEASIRLSIPGPGFIDADGNLMQGTGPWVIFLEGQILYLVGHITFEPDPFGVRAAEVRGRTVDLCDVLAA